MEAYTIMQVEVPGGGEFQGFFSTGGASAQFGLRLCSKKVEKKWHALLRDRASGVFESQCHEGTSFSANHFMSWSTEEDIKANNGRKLQGWGDFAEGMWCNNDEGPCWALGSLFQCPGYNRAVEVAADAASDGGVAGYKATYYSMVKRMSGGMVNLDNAIAGAGQPITEDGVEQFFKRDTYIKALTDPFTSLVGGDTKGFMEAWIEDCLPEDSSKKIAFGPAFPEQEVQFRQNEVDDNPGPTTKSIQIAQEPPGGNNFKLEGWSPMNAWGWMVSLGFVRDKHLTSQLKAMNGLMDWGQYMGELGATEGINTDWIGLEKDLKGLERSIHQLEK